MSKHSIKAFTLIELLAVIIILGVLMIIAIPSVTEYISSSRKNAYITTAGQYISGARNKINSAEIPIYDVDTTYYLPASCISLEKGGNSPFGEWKEAYVVVTYDGFGYDYYWTSRDSANMGIHLVNERLLNSDLIIAGVKSISTTISVGDRDKIVVIGNGCSIEDSEELFPEYNILDDGILSKEEADSVLSQTFNKPTLFATDSNISLLKGNYNKNEIENIKFVNTNVVPEVVLKSWDVSSDGDGSVMAWTLDEDNNNMYELYVGAKYRIYANSNSSYLFYNYVNLKNIDLRYLNTSNVTNMSYMFDNCKSLKSLDVSSFNTSNVTNMSYMFSGMGTDPDKRMNLEYIYGLDRFDTSNVTSMRAMFSYCGKLKSLNLSSFDTSKVTDMSHMFGGWFNIEGITSLDLSTFDTSNVIDISSMFSFSNNLRNINFGNFETENVVNMKDMFQYCENLNSVDLSSFETGKVTDMSGLFSYSGIKNINLSSFDTTSVEKISNLFYSSDVEVVYFPVIDFTNINDYNNIFDSYSQAHVYVKDETAKNFLTSLNSLLVIELY